MELLKIEIRKSKMSLIPRNERVFFVQIGNLLNDLSMLQKLTVFCTNNKPTNEVVRAAVNMQTFSLLRIQAGKLHEGWKLLQKNFVKTEFYQDYVKQLNDLEKESFEKVNAYFRNKENLISWIRNKIAFHYHTSSTKIGQLIDEIPNSETFEIFMSEHYGNCLFSMSNVLVTYLILEYTGIANTEKAIEKVLRDITEVTRWFGDFLGRFLLVFAEEHIGLQSTKVEIPEPPNINEVILPYFTKG